MDELIRYIHKQYNLISNLEEVISRCFEIDNIEYTIISRNNSISIGALNNKTDRFVKLDTKKYSKFIESLKNDSVSIELKNGRVYIHLITPEHKSKIYGYCRVSSKGQLDNNSLEQQQEEILSKYRK